MIIVLATPDSQDRERYTHWLTTRSPHEIEVMETTSGRQTLDACHGSKPDCLILHDQLSDMSGLEFLEKYHQSSILTTTPLIFVASQHDDALATTVREFGTLDYVLKPTLSEELLWKIIQHAIERQAILYRMQTLEHQYSAILQSSLDGIVVIGSNGKIRFTNHAAEHFFQRSPSDLLGSPFGFPVVAGQTSEIEIHHSDGGTTPIEMRVVPIEWEQEGAYLVSLRNLTERRKAENERHRLETERQYSQKLESLGVLAGGIAHDFNNLLMTIVARSGLALRSLPADSPAREHITFIEKSGLRGGELANQMLTFAGKTKIDFQSVQLSKFLKDMEVFLRATISKRMTLTYDLAPSLPIIRADPAQLRQIIMNVVTNASEAHADKEGTITITTTEFDPKAFDPRSWYLIGDPPTTPCPMLQVQDSGCGMKAEVIPKIFDPFFSTKFPGRGLGLAALLGITRAHSATIAVKSQPGTGTDFCLIFPAKPVESRQEKSPLLSIPSTRTTSEKKPVILIVDDEEEVRVACSLILQELGCHALVAADGEVGVQVFQEHQNDISAILLDLTMPKLDGQQCFKKIRALSGQVPVILSSGYSEEEAMKQFQNSGINAFIQKPYQVEVLIQKIQALTTETLIEEHPLP